MECEGSLVSRQRLRLVYPETLALACFELLLVVAGVLFEPGNLALGLERVVCSPGILITDYVLVGGLGPALVNAGLVGMIGVILTALCRKRPSGMEVAGVLTMTGFALFGKNPVNVLPIIAGVHLNAVVRRKPFGCNLGAAMFGTALAPMVSQAVYGLGWNVFAGTGIGLLTGFLIPSLAPVLSQCHGGLNLYNVGFTAGFVGSIAFAVKSSFAFRFEPVLFWSTHCSRTLSAFFLLIFTGAALAGIIVARGIPRRYSTILKSPGTLPSDFAKTAGWDAVLLNIGLVGLSGWAYIHLVGGIFNGPTVGGLLTMAGFAAFGKHPFNIGPVMAGVYLASRLMVFKTSAPGPLLAALFGTALAPVSGVFGPVAGVVAGFLHVAVVMNVGWLHGGMNLYNNGFSAGIVATLMYAGWPAIVGLWSGVNSRIASLFQVDVTNRSTVDGKPPVDGE